MKPADHQKAMVRLIDDIRAGTGQRVWQIFTDWVECCAISLCSPFPHRDRETREERYARHEKTYGPENITRFAQLLGHLTMWLEREPTDALGELYMSLDLGNPDTGQNFTPYEASRLMAGLTIDTEDLNNRVEQNGFITVNDPAVGAGGMLVAFSERMKQAGLNPQRQLHASGTDIDLTCVHMSHIQLSLLGIPAVIVHGNTLTLEERSHWFTPFHYLGVWDYRLKETPTVSSALQLPPGRTEQTGLFEAIA